MNDPHSSYGPILGRYQVISELAKSRIGGLVMAVDIPESRVVALRSFPLETRFDAESAAQLLEAGRWVKGLEDPSVMTPLEIGTQEGLLHAAYNYDISEPLRAVLRLAAFKGQAFPVGVALRIAYDITLGARAIEACGAPPRVGDSLCGALLPDSVMVGENGRTLLCDAGISAVLRREKAIAEHPDVLAYAAPEQTRSAGPVDGRTDVFTIGILLWEMLANRRLFASLELGKPREFEVPLLKSVARPVDDPIPSSITAIVERALAPAPASRHSGSSALLQAIESQCRDILAPKEAVRSFMVELFGNIFESRARAIERAIAAAPRESFSLAPPSVAETRGAASDTTHKLTASSTAPRAATDARTVDSSSSQEEPPSKPMPGRLPSLPPPPVSSRSVRSSPVFGSKPPPMPAIPALPKQFELPGADLFATPGLPPVKHQAPASEAPKAPPISEQPPPDPEPRSTQPEVDAVQSPSEGVAHLLEPDNAVVAAGAPLAKRRFKITWVALLSVVACAFVGGAAARRCARHEATAPPVRIDTEAVRVSIDAGEHLAPKASTSVAPTEVKADAGSAESESPAPSTPADAGTSASSMSPVMKIPAPARAQSYRAPKYNSKVTKGTGKTTRH